MGTLSDTPPTPYRWQACRPLHRNPQSLPLTTRNSCEAKPYCLLLPCIKIFLLFFNLGFGKILAAENFGSMTASPSLNSKSCIHLIYTISKISKLWQPAYQHILTTNYVHTYVPLYNFKVCSYKILILITALKLMSGPILLCSSVLRTCTWKIVFKMETNEPNELSECILL